MNFLNNLERKIGKHPIQGLMKYVIACYVIGYILYYAQPAFLNYLTLEPALILQGQVWRLISWMIIPPSSSLIWALIMTVFYYQLGTALEQTWGSFRFNVFMFGGIIFTIIGAFILYFLTGSYINLGTTITSYYLCLSIFLAFAISYPDHQVLLWFIIPVKMKWMAAIYAVLAIVGAVNSGWGTRVAIIASLVNLLIFWLLQRGYRYSPKEMKRKRSFQKSFQAGTMGGASSQTNAGASKGSRSTVISKHRCAVCNRTELDDPTLEFRFCTKCNGNYEYCQDHLFTHKHIL